MKRFRWAFILSFFLLPLYYGFSDIDFISSSKYLSGKYANPAQVSCVQSHELFFNYQWYLDIENIYYLTAGIYKNMGFSHVGFVFQKTDIELEKGDEPQVSDFNNLIYQIYNTYSFHRANIGFLLSIPHINSKEGDFRSFDMSPGIMYDLKIIEIGGVVHNLFTLNQYTENEEEYVLGYSKIFSLNKLKMRFSNDFSYIHELHMGLGLDSIFLTGESSYLMFSLAYKNGYIVGLSVSEKIIQAEYKMYIVPVLGIKNNINLSFLF